MTRGLGKIRLRTGASLIECHARHLGSQPEWQWHLRRPLQSLRTTGRRSFTFCPPFSSSAALPSNKLHIKKWRQPVASVLDLGGANIAKDGVLSDEPTNNVPDTIFAKLGLQLHRRGQHPLGILKNAIYEYFDTSCSYKLDKFDYLGPIVSVKEMEGVRVFSPQDWEASETDATSYVAGDLKECLEGLARHLFDKITVATILNRRAEYQTYL